MRYQEQCGREISHISELYLELYLGKLMDGAECQILLATGASKSYL